ncbi:MAG: DUF3825 domain-containing protein [Ignavibacteriales bacterium]|nr:DUF3825 domain-containing protein [Ignavibacteriales bacterium]
MFEQQELLEQLGSPYTNRVVDRLHRFAVIPPQILTSLATQALTEHWGNDNYVLEKYLSVHIPWSIEQNRYTHSENQFYSTAGHLQTRYGTPIYLVFAQNAAGTPPWRIITIGSQISAPQLPTPPEIPSPPEIPKGAEIVMIHDHILGENAERVSFLRGTPPVAQMCAVSGAIQWSLNRHLEFPYFYFGKMNYLVPLYLQSRENITLAPDIVAPIQVNPDSLLVRTALPPVAPYPNARVSVKRHDQLPAWMLSSWADAFREVSRATIDDPEAATADGH